MTSRRNLHILTAAGTTRDTTATLTVRETDRATHVVIAMDDGEIWECEVVPVGAEAEQPEVWGDGCECWVTPEKYWVSAFSCGYGSGYEPGSQIEYNPDCPKHGSAS